MRQTSRIWQTASLLVGGLCLGSFWIAPAMAATVTYTFSGIVTEIDSAQTAPLPFKTSGPKLRTSRSINGFPTLRVKSESHATHFGSRTPLKVGSYQVYFPSTPGDYRVDISRADFSKVSGINSVQDRFTLTPNSLINSWLPQTSLAPLERPPSHVDHPALLGPSDFPPSISALSRASEWRRPFDSAPGPTNPVTIAHGKIAPSTTVPLPASLIIAGVGLVALIGLGAGGLRAN